MTNYLSFISPQVGERHQATIQQLAEKTGYALSIHPHPNQQQILQIAQQLMYTAGWGIRKGPGIHLDRGEITVSLSEDPAPDIVEEVATVLEDRTGYRLVLN